MKQLWVIVAILLSWSAFGQVRPVYSSIESIAAGARVICVGKISKIQDVTIDGYGMAELTIDVSETLKGPRQTSVRAHRHGNFGYDTKQYYAAAQKAGVEFVWFVPKDTAQTEYSLDPGSSPYGYFGGLAIGMDYRILRTRQDVLDRIRKFLKENPSPNGGEALLTPLPGRSLTAFVDFIIPICPWTEKLGVRMVTRPETFTFGPAKGNPYKPGSAPNLEKSKAGMLRTEGLILLRHFKSESNIRLVKQYLSDDSVVARNGSQKGAYYWVRDAAYRLLSLWDVTVEKPSVDAPPVDEMDGYFQTDGRRIEYMLRRK